MHHFVAIILQFKCSFTVTAVFFLISTFLNKKGTETVEQRVLPSSPLVVSDEETRNQELVDSALGVPAVMKKVGLIVFPHLISNF